VHQKQKVEKFLFKLLDKTKFDTMPQPRNAKGGNKKAKVDQEMDPAYVAKRERNNLVR
jgi:hypothetical protein